MMNKINNYLFRAKEHDKRKLKNEHIEKCEKKKLFHPHSNFLPQLQINKLDAMLGKFNFKSF